MKKLKLSQAGRIALLYALVSGLWVVLSDPLLALLTKDADLLAFLQLAKGWSFVAITSVLIYLERSRADHETGDLANIVTYSEDAIISLSLDGQITSWNPGAEAIYGYRAAEAKGKPATLVIPPERADEPIKYLELIKRGEHIEPYETERVAKDGNRLRISLSVSPIKDNSGSIVGASTIGRNITEQKKMAARLAAQQAALRRYALQILISQEEERKRISRELHDQTVQDLVGLTQRIELLRNEIGRDPIRVKRHLEDLELLVEEAMADVRRMSSDLRPVILEDLGLSASLDELCDELLDKMPAAHVMFGVQGDKRVLPPELELTIYRLVQEALTNVRKHASNATHVRVMLFFEDWGMLVSVEDDGPGFEVPELDELTREGQLGLTGMRERVRLFDGEMSIESAPGRGTTVIFRLPTPQSV
jgi:two-component system sensor histidine kinase UhpB